MNWCNDKGLLFVLYSSHNRSKNWKQILGESFSVATERNAILFSTIYCIVCLI